MMLAKGRAAPLAMLAALLLAAACIGGALALSGDTASVGGNTFATDTLDPPTGLTGTPGTAEGTIDLSWTATTDTYASGYRVFRSSASGGPYSQIAQVTPRTTTTFQDSGLSNGTTYYYVLRSYYQSWESANSGQASAAAPGVLNLQENDTDMSTATSPTGNIDTNNGQTDYFTNTSPVTYASNATNWTVVMVQRDKPDVNAPATINVWWRSGGACSSGPVAGQIFATGSVTVPIKVDRKGVTLTVPKTAGSVSRTFQSGDLLCMSIRADGSGGSNDLRYYANITSTSGTTGVSRLVGPFTQPRSGAAVWRSGTLTTPRYNIWNGEAFGNSVSSANVGTWRIMAGAAAPTRNEKIVVGIDSSSVIAGEIWNGSGWSALPFNPLATVSVSFYWAFDVVYERQSGDAVLVWNNGTSGTSGISYRIWNGSTWSSASTITTPLSGEPRHMYAAANPNSDEIVLIVNSSGGDYSLVWSGASWGNAQILDTSAGDTDIYVAYEALSGRAIVVYGKTPDAKGYYRIWDGSTWSAEATITPPAGETLRPRWMTLGSDASSNRIALGVVTAGDGINSHIWLNVWNGASWSTAVTATALQTNNMNYPNVAVAFESLTGKAMATYEANTSTANVHYRTWTSGSGWSAQLTGPAIGGNGNSKTLDADKSTNKIMLSVQDSASDLHYVLWNGTSWGTPSTQETNTGETKNQPFLFLWD